MDAEQEQSLKEKLDEVGYPDFELLPGEDDVLMIHAQGHLICGALHALSMSNKWLEALIDETVGIHGD
jgi:hypothetical protein